MLKHELMVQFLMNRQTGSQLLKPIVPIPMTGVGQSYTSQSVLHACLEKKYTPTTTFLVQNTNTRPLRAPHFRKEKEIPTNF